VEKEKEKAEGRRGEGIHLNVDNEKTKKGSLRTADAPSALLGEKKGTGKREIS